MRNQQTIATAAATAQVLPLRANHFLQHLTNNAYQECRLGGWKPHALFALASVATGAFVAGASYVDGQLNQSSAVMTGIAVGSSLLLGALVPVASFLGDINISDAWRHRRDPRYDRNNPLYNRSR